MKQKERIINDIKDVLKFYELEHFDEYMTIESIEHLVAQACHNCGYQQDGCNAPQGKTCHDGFRAYIDSEV